MRRRAYSEHDFDVIVDQFELDCERNGLPEDIEERVEKYVKSNGYGDKELVEDVVYFLQHHFDEDGRKKNASANRISKELIRIARMLNSIENYDDSVRQSGGGRTSSVRRVADAKGAASNFAQTLGADFPIMVENYCKQLGEQMDDEVKYDRFAKEIRSTCRKVAEKVYKAVWNSPEALDDLYDEVVNAIKYAYGVVGKPDDLVDLGKSIINMMDEITDDKSIRRASSVRRVADA